MIGLVTLEQCKSHLRIDGTDSDSNLQLLIYAASRIVLNYLKRDEDYYLNSDGTMDIDTDTQGYFEVEAEVQVATMIMVGKLYDDPSGEEVEKWSHGYPPIPVLSILYPLRDPSLA